MEPDDKDWWLDDQNDQPADHTDSPLENNQHVQGLLRSTIAGILALICVRQTERSPAQFSPLVSHQQSSLVNARKTIFYSLFTTIVLRIY